MIPLELVIKASKLHESRIFNVYVFGSQVYETDTSSSDWDIIIVANNSVESVELRHEQFNIHILTPDKFKEDLKWHKPTILECAFAPPYAKLKESIKFNQFIIDKKKLRHAILHTSFMSWKKSKSKIDTSEYHSAIKSAFHSIRLIMFGIQIARSGKINNFCEANIIWRRLSEKRWTSTELDLEFLQLRTDKVKEFEKLLNIK